MPRSLATVLTLVFACVLGGCVSTGALPEWAYTKRYMARDGNSAAYSRGYLVRKVRYRRVRQRRVEPVTPAPASVPAAVPTTETAPAAPSK